MSGMDWLYSDEMVEIERKIAAELRQWMNGPSPVWQWAMDNLDHSIKCRCRKCKAWIYGS